MITPLKQFMLKWLDLMEDAYFKLSDKEFAELEDKIRKEISARRRNKGKKE